MGGGVKAEGHGETRWHTHQGRCQMGQHREGVEGIRETGRGEIDGAEWGGEGLECVNEGVIGG